jgi:hypothetical protein
VDTELDDFKTHINLTEYAAGQGYALDRKESSRNSAVMRHADGDKVIVARDTDAHWIYFSVRDEGDNGSIIDFVQNRLRCSLGRVRQELRGWSGLPVSRRPQPSLFTEDLEPVTKDRARVLMDLARSRVLGYHRYLEEGRGIPRRLLQSPRFAGKLKVDGRANAVFPHADQDGPCGYELKNRTFTGFSKGGDKGLWFSACHQGDRTLVIAESGVDALSYAALHPDPGARYASTGGSLNPNQPALIRSAIEKLGQGKSGSFSSRVVIATDNDEGGRALADTLEALSAETGRADLTVIRHLPEGDGQDWNDVLRRREGIGPVPPAP